MTRTITALFDSRPDAEAGAERLRAAGIDAGSVSVHDNSTHKTAGAYSTKEDRGLWASIKSAFVPDKDRHAYEEGIRRGGFLLTADVADDKTPAAVRALEEANSVDLDARTEQWRNEGWDYQSTGSTVDEDLSDADLYGVRDPDMGGSRFRSYSSLTRPN